jgi:membrane dipeptidase
MKPMNIFDLHCDTLMPVYIDGYNLKNWNGHINLDKMQQGGAMVQCFAIYIPTNRSAEYHNVKEGPYEYWQGCVNAFDKQMADNADLIRQVRCIADIEQNVKDGKMSALLTVENGVALDGKIERVQECYDRGVRMIGLTWNYENSVGFPCSDDPELHKLGLKPFGLEVVSKMDELGMVVDVSHLSEGGFWDVVNHGKNPFMASHSCARALCDHRRNLTDEQMKALANKGGIVGVNFENSFLRKGSKTTDVSDITWHMKHMINVGGLDMVALGSDFDGIGDNLNFKDYAGIPQLVDAIEKEFGAAACDKICHGNALRLFKEVIG